MLAALTLSMATPIAFKDVLETRAETLRLGELAELEMLPVELQKRAAQIEVARLSSIGQAISIDHDGLASKARALLPALAPWLSSNYEGTLKVNSANAARGLPVADCGKGVETGEMISVRYTVGAFSVERQVTMLEPAESGQRFFARTTDGEALTGTCREVAL